MPVAAPERGAACADRGQEQDGAQDAGGVRSPSAEVCLTTAWHLTQNKRHWHMRGRGSVPCGRKHPRAHALAAHLPRRRTVHAELWAIYRCISLAAALRSVPNGASRSSCVRKAVDTLSPPGCRLRRVRYGEVCLGDDLPPGGVRALHRAELAWATDLARNRSPV